MKFSTNVLLIILATIYACDQISSSTSTRVSPSGVINWAVGSWLGLELPCPGAVRASPRVHDMTFDFPSLALTHYAPSHLPSCFDFRTRSRRIYCRNLELLELHAGNRQRYVTVLSFMV
jgi:hypothetical protein